MSLGFEDCKVFVSTVDSQSSAEGGIIIQVVGELSNRGGPWRKFAQTFFLAEQPNGYFVLNDIFRYIKEESDEDETSPAAEDVASASAPAQQEVTYDELANASIVGGQQQQQSAAPAAHQDFELSQQHGSPADAAGVTVAPPTEAHQEDARANLEDLANGQAEQQQVVELHEDLTQEQLDSSAATQAQQQSSAPAQVNGDHTHAATASPAVPTEVEAPASAADPASSIAESQATKSKGKAPATEAPAQTATPAAAPVQETPKPAAPKSWATLAASGQAKWRGTVVSSTAGVTSSVPASSAGASRSSTPAGPSDNKASTAAAAGAESSQKGTDREGFQTQTSRSNKDQNRPPRDQQQQGEQRKFTNTETPWSIILENVTEEISHGMLRSRLSDFITQQNGSRKEHAKISYLDIDRRKSTAYVDFEEQWAQTKAVEKGTFKIAETEVVITQGKGDRRDASGLGTGKAYPGGKGRGQGQGQQGQKGSAGQGGANRGPQRDGQQRSQRGGRGGGAVKP